MPAAARLPGWSVDRIVTQSEAGLRARLSLEAALFSGLKRRLRRRTETPAKGCELIEQCGYWRRKEELEDAEANHQAAPLRCRRAEGA